MEQNNLRISGALLAVLGVVLFSSKAVMVKWAYRFGVGTVDLLLFRMLFALPFYVGVVFWGENRSKLTELGLKEILQLLFLGFVGYYLASLLDFMGLKYIKAGLERVVLFVYPTLVVLLSWLFFKERLSKKGWWAIGVTYIGVLVVFFPELELGGVHVLLGTALVFGSAFTYAIYIVGSGRLIPRLGSARFTAYSMIVASVCVFIHYGFQAQGGLWEYPWQVYFIGVLMALFATVIPSFLIAAAIKRMGASRFSIFGSLGPVSTILLAYVFLGERIGGWQWLGMGIVILGVRLVGKRDKG
ncbi:DMT family transporter [Sediminicola luteus]|uniref:EamA family transporter n=1 Tax=Sediminicola luteus TaxID=319238 RepID=A0A2A4G7M5_9FLAO|nr:DMT family transporter [Sediminicola luteus]PCE63980.1 EamA family transporter [Sediminicola luteus]